MDGLASGDIVNSYLCTEEVTSGTDQTTPIIRQGRNGETRHPLGCFAIYANNNCIPTVIDDGIGISCNIIRLDQFQLEDMFNDADSLQELFDYFPMCCYRNYLLVTLHLPGDQRPALSG